MGLLDTFNTYEGQQALGLLAAAGPRSDGAGFGQRLQEGLGYADKWQQGKSEQAMKKMQMDGAMRKMQQEQQQEIEQARIRSLVAGGSTDYQSLLRQGVPFETVKQLADSRNLGRDEVARTVETEGPNGTKLVQGFDKWGAPVGQGANGYVAPQLIDQGDRKTFAKPMIGQSFGMGMSPEGRDASARGWAGVNQSAARLAFDKAGGVGGKAPAGYRFTPDGNMEAIPGGPADIKASQAGVTKGNEAREAVAIIDEAEKLIPLSTGSGIGSMVDSAAGFFGASPKGAQAGARLKALEGMLVSKMPKMSGPQSDKDVLLYKQMAGQIGDTSLPVKTRMSALETIKGIQRQYSAGGSGASGGWGAPAKSGGWSIQKAD